MTYQTERAAIEAFIAANFVSGSIGYDMQTFTPSAGDILVTINSGAVMDGTLGRASNRIDHIGVVQIMIYTEAGKGSAAWRAIAETLQGFLLEARITNAGAAIAAVDEEFIRFTPHPYIAGTQQEAGMLITTLNAPFVRYEA